MKLISNLCQLTVCTILQLHKTIVSDETSNEDLKANDILDEKMLTKRSTQQIFFNVIMRVLFINEERSMPNSSLTPNDCSGLRSNGQAQELQSLTQLTSRH